MLPAWGEDFLEAGKEYKHMYVNDQGKCHR
jgi:hypothetical protein